MHSILRSASAQALASTLAAFALLLSTGGATRAQGKKPITKKGMLTAIKINGLSTREFIRQIETRGVDFEMTASDESDIRNAGGRPEIIEAARANYRPAGAARPTTPAAATTTASRPPARPATGGPVPSGPPLSKDAILELLRNGVPAERVERNVEARGVNFSMTPDIAREINAAGGNRSLIGAITEKSTEVASSGNSGNSGGSVFNAGPETTGPTYDDLIESAGNAYLSSNYNGARTYIQQAVQLDGQNPTAYQLIGLWALNEGQLPTAEQAMRAALERNGSAPFKVAHDHDGSFTNYCVGSFFVSKTGVSFVADDGRHTFEVADSNIKEVKKNGFVGAAIGAFHVKPVAKVRDNDGKERDNFNLAPVSGNKAVSDLIVRLALAY
jgi:hypothetical protein